jgi:hypothetical protein
MKSFWIGFLSIIVCFAPAVADEPTDVIEQLKVFQPLIGKTFKGEFAESTPEKPMFDISHWERAMNGQAIRVLHSVNDGIYGGETIIMWDAQQQKIAFWYFTTAGFFTQGTMDIDGKKWSSTEKVTGNEQGITEVRSTAEYSSDGKLVVNAEYFHDGKWDKGHEIHYVEAPDAKVIFK